MFMLLPNLHNTSKRHLNKIETFLQKNDSYLGKCKFARRFQDFNSSKFLEILKYHLRKRTEVKEASLKILPILVLLPHSLYVCDAPSKVRKSHFCKFEIVIKFDIKFVIFIVDINQIRYRNFFGLESMRF